ncbi:hypothetical protein [Burkholderia multivorans]|uniref:hypothetical protein n=1 Tax=Burkholderia multivorans TaxID=87883 RepID=UPI000A85D3A6|nr:hypothetical protein [Burkholderia multivorans]MDR9230004.1 hypothetical protein [Burkholderia multivorans]HDR9474368.1 hypothetical protein [Burkholderia multivorans]HDR9480210.1 hypothetical protein [Burkholderia multivorans]
MINYRTARSLRSVFIVSILATAAITSGVHAQEAAHGAVAAQDNATADLDEPANLNDDTNRFVYRRYTNDTRTNDRLNAVFHLIQTQGNGLIWDGESRPTSEPASGPAIVTASIHSSSEKVPKAETTKEVAAPPAAESKSAPAPEPVLTWTFNPNATAQQTLSSWAKIAGWKEPAWNAKNAFQGRGEIHGTFLDALRALAAAAPQLNFTASLETKNITVTDASGF